MASLVRVDTADLWNLYLSIADIGDMAAEESEEIAKVLGHLRDRIQMKKKQIRQQIDLLQAEAAQLQRKIQNKEDSNSSDNGDEAKLQALKARIAQLEQYIDELSRAENRIPTYETKLQKQMKECKLSLAAGKRKISRYLRFVEQMTEEEGFNSYQNSPSALPSAASESGRQYFVMNFRGVSFYCNDEELNLDADGGANMERMSRGLAPIGKDGRPVNLHHMQQSDSYGGIMEVSETRHTKNHKELHINSNNTPSGINRGAFTNLKSAYWRRRAAYIKRSQV